MGGGPGGPSGARVRQVALGRLRGGLRRRAPDGRRRRARATGLAGASAGGRGGGLRSDRGGRPARPPRAGHRRFATGGGAGRSGARGGRAGRRRRSPSRRPGRGGIRLRPATPAARSRPVTPGHHLGAGPGRRRSGGPGGVGARLPRRQRRRDRRPVVRTGGRRQAGRHHGLLRAGGLLRPRHPRARHPGGAEPDLGNGARAVGHARPPRPVVGAPGGAGRGQGRPDVAGRPRRHLPVGLRNPRRHAGSAGGQFGAVARGADRAGGVLPGGHALARAVRAGLPEPAAAGPPLPGSARRLDVGDRAPARAAAHHLRAPGRSPVQVVAPPTGRTGRTPSLAGR